jgi:hypothetical protein
MGGEAQITNLTISDAVFDIRVKDRGVGLGAVSGSQEAVISMHGSKIDSITIRRSRLSVTSEHLGACFGAIYLGLYGADVNVGEMGFEDSELLCTLSEVGGIGIGSGLAGVGATLLVGPVTLKNTAVNCTINGGVCIVTGEITSGSSKVGNITIEGGRIVAASGDPSVSCKGIGGDVENVELNSAVVDCESVGPSCIQVNGLTISTSLVGKTRTKKFFDATSITWESDIPLTVKYLNSSDPETITSKRLLHLGEINYFDHFAYDLSIDGFESGNTVAMDGSEVGVLMSVPDSAKGGVSHSATRYNEAIRGSVLNPDSSPIVFDSGETVVTGPIFGLPTAPFRQTFDPYRLKKRLIQIGVFTIMVRW